MTADAPAVRHRPKDRKQQILVHARDLFLELGYPSVSMAMIADRVGITAGALYRHYATKAELLEAVVRDAFSATVPAAGGLSLEELIDREIAAVAGRPHMADLWSREARYLPGEMRREIRAVMRQAAQAYVAPLRAHRAGLTAVQAELIAWSIQSVLSCLGRDSVRLPAGSGQALVRGAARALPDLPLPDRPLEDVPPENLPPESGGARPRRPAGLAPASTRERLLIAARRQFAAAGYQETSMASIGAEADVTGQNLYGYFDNKAALLRAVLDRGTQALWLNLDAVLETAEDPAAALRLVVAGYVRLSRDWALLRLDLVGDPGLAEEFKGAQREYIAEWVALLRAVRPALAPAEARALVQTALTVVNDLRRTWHLARQPGFVAWLTAIAEAILASAQEPARRT
jgi:AcrR family transcriptional regulator